MSEVNPLIAAILATAIIEPKPKKGAARRAVEAYLRVTKELARVPAKPDASPGERPPGDREQWPERPSARAARSGAGARRRPAGRAAES